VTFGPKGPLLASSGGGAAVAHTGVAAATSSGGGGTPTTPGPGPGVITVDVDGAPLPAQVLAIAREVLTDARNHDRVALDRLLDPTDPNSAQIIALNKLLAQPGVYQQNRHTPHKDPRRRPGRLYRLARLSPGRNGQSSHRGRR
jgi:hypothetical protein